MKTPSKGKVISDVLARFMPRFIRHIHPVIHCYKTPEYDLGENQIKAIMAVDSMGKASPTVLSRALMMQKGSLTTIIRSLVAKGLLRKQSDENDDRKYHLYLTDKGKAFVDEKRAHNIEQLDLIFNDMPKDDIRKVTDGLETLTDYLKKGESE